MKYTDDPILDEKIDVVVNQTIQRFLNEGIDFDPKTMTVSYNPSHENNVDTSLENNPTVDSKIIRGVKVWSIFKRKADSDDDGNPLISALKGERWKFRSEADRQAIEDRFDEIAEKFAQIYPIGATIIILSGNDLNRHIAEVIMSKSENSVLLEGLICKMTTEEVEEIVLDMDSPFRKYYKDDFNYALRQLRYYLRDMDKKRGGTFARHLVHDPKMRNVIMNTLKLSDEVYAKDSRYINGEDILLIDDTISRGQTIREACKIMLESYEPKSVTVLTLMSKLY